MRILVAVLRAAIGLLGVAAIVATFLDTASRGPVNPFNFFGFFTIQGNIAGVVVLLLLAAAGRCVETAVTRLELARACITTYLVVVGVVYNTLLVGLPGGVALPWANTVLHVVTPIYVVIDWALFGDRDPIPWRRFWVVLVYPLVWVAVVLVRGATDGWVPYPFLDPATGYGSISLYVIAIAVAIGAVGAAVWAYSPVRLVRIPDVAALR